MFTLATLIMISLRLLDDSLTTVKLRVTFSVPNINKKLWLYLSGNLRSVAQFKHLFWGPLANLAFENNHYVLSKNCSSLGTRLKPPVYNIVLELKHSIQNRGREHSLSHHSWYSQSTCWSVAKACVKWQKVSSLRQIRCSAAVVDIYPTRKLLY